MRIQSGRILDYAVVAILAIPVAILLAFVALFVIVSDGRPVLFAQKRIGRFDRPATESFGRLPFGGKILRFFPTVHQTSGLESNRVTQTQICHKSGCADIESPVETARGLD